MTEISNGEGLASVQNKIEALIDDYVGVTSGAEYIDTWGDARTKLNAIADVLALDTIGATDSGLDARTKINALLAGGPSLDFSAPISGQYLPIIF